MKEETLSSTNPPATHGYKDIGEEGVAEEPASAEHVDIPGGPPGSGRSADDPSVREAMEKARRRQRHRENELE